MSLKNLSLSNRQEIYNICFDVPSMRIKKKYKVSDSYIEFIKMQKIKDTICHSHGIFGSKKEAYATEQEILEGFSCTYEQLSESEKRIYNSL